MLDVSNYLHNASLLLVGLALLAYIAAMASRLRHDERAAEAAEEPAEERVLVGVGGRGAPDVHGDVAAAGSDTGGTVRDAPPRGLGWYSDRLVDLALVALTASLGLRWMETGHAPFANQFEFSTAFVWGALATYVWFRVRFEIRDLALLVLPFAVAMLLYASSMGRTADPLIPALQNSLLLTLHVFSAVIAYGAAAISFAAAVLYLVHPHIPWRRLPAAEKLDEIGYRAVVLTFPMLTLMLILGALWADIAWGRYWSWDPKETSALVTWLIYGAYLHARVTAGWHGRRAAWLLVLGFAAVIFTFTGNHWFGGMHSYA